MNKLICKIEKKVYVKPIIEIIEIDLQISLQYTSPGSNPEGDELGNNEYLKSDPFKASLT